MPKTEDVIKWTNRYKKKVGKDFFEDWDREFYPLIYIHDDGSLFTYTLLKDRLEIGPFSGDAKVAEPILTSIAKFHKLKYLSAITSRNPIAYERLTKAKLVDSREINGVMHHYFLKEV